MGNKIKRNTARETRVCEEVDYHGIGIAKGQGGKTRVDVKSQSKGSPAPEPREYQSCTKTKASGSGPVKKKKGGETGAARGTTRAERRFTKTFSKGHKVGTRAKKKKQDSEKKKWWFTEVGHSKKSGEKVTRLWKSTKMWKEAGGKQCVNREKGRGGQRKKLLGKKDKKKGGPREAD